jgi:hypothetical protein
MLLPAAFLTVKLTVYFPVLVYQFLVVEVLLSLKFQDQEAGLFIFLSVNLTVIGTFPESMLA